MDFCMKRLVNSLLSIGQITDDTTLLDKQRIQHRIAENDKKWTIWKRIKNQLVTIFIDFFTVFWWTKLFLILFWDRKFYQPQVSL